MIKKTIWVVDDDAVYQIIIRKIIKKSEMVSNTVTFPNGYEAMTALKKVLENNELLPDIILLDINMPIMDGWEFMEELVPLKSQFKKQIAIYIVSSSIAIEDKYKAKSYLDILGYLSKPVTLDDMKMIASANK